MNKQRDKEDLLEIPLSARNKSILRFLYEDSRMSTIPAYVANKLNIELQTFYVEIRYLAKLGFIHFDKHMDLFQLTHSGIERVRSF